MHMTQFVELKTVLYVSCKIYSCVTKIFTYVFIQLLTYVIHFYVSTNYTIIITIVLTLQLLIYVIHLYVSINYYVHVRKCLLF